MRIRQGSNYSCYGVLTQKQQCRWPSQIWTHSYRHRAVCIFMDVFPLARWFLTDFICKIEKGGKETERKGGIGLYGVLRPWGLCLWTLITKPVNSQGLQNLDKWSRNALQLPNTCRLLFGDACRVQAACSGQAPAQKIQFRKYWSLTNASST